MYGCRHPAHRLDGSARPQQLDRALPPKARPKHRFVLLAAVVAAAMPSAWTATAMVGPAMPGGDGVGRSVVTIVGSRGTFCSGALIAPELVLSAAHCVLPGAEYKIVLYDAKRQPHLQDVRRAASHPRFDVQGIASHRASADVALLQLSKPLPGMPAPLGVPIEPLMPGRSFTVAGVGVARQGDGSSGGTVRLANLVATGRPGRLQIRLVDPTTDNKRDGAGACTGDSGAPVFEDQQGRAVIVGVVGWSTGPHDSAGCGGLTGVTPLSLYRDWILQTARSWGTAL